MNSFLTDLFSDLETCTSHWRKAPCQWCSSGYIFRRLPRKQKKRLKRDMGATGKISYEPRYEDGVFTSLHVWELS
jgi:hypothetical protein